MKKILSNVFRRFITKDDASTSKDQFCLTKTIDIGYPHSPTAIAYDKKRNLIAITAKNILHVYGNPGTEVRCNVEENAKYLFFVEKTGQILSVGTKHITLHELHDFEDESMLSLVKSVEMDTITDYRVSCAIIAYDKLWLTLDNRLWTDNEDIILLDLVNFFPTKTIFIRNQERNDGRDVFIVSISQNPAEPFLFLICFNHGVIIIWDSVRKKNVNKLILNANVSSVSWNFEGNSFACAFTDGKYSIFNKGCATNMYKISLYDEVCCGPIRRFEFISSNNYLCFVGGAPVSFHCEDTLTLLNPHKQMVFQFNSDIVDFLIIRNHTDEPRVLLVFTILELVAIDLDQWKEIKLSYLCSMNIPEIMTSQHVFLKHRTSQMFRSLSPGDGNVTSYVPSSTKSWIEKSSTKGDKDEVIITGHVGGMITIWHVSRHGVHPLYRMDTAKYFGFQSKDIADTEYPPITQTLSHNFMLNSNSRYVINDLHYDSECNTLVVCGFVNYVMIFDCSVVLRERDDKSNIMVTTVNIVNSAESYNSVQIPYFKNNCGDFKLMSVFKLSTSCERVTLSLYTQSKKLAIGTVNGFALLDYGNNSCIYSLDTCSSNHRIGRTTSFRRLNNSFRRSLVRALSCTTLVPERSSTSFLTDYSIETIYLARTHLPNTLVNSSCGLKMFVGTSSGRLLIFTVESHPTVNDDRFQTPMVDLATEILLVNKDPIIRIMVLTSQFSPLQANNHENHVLIICTSRKVKIYSLKDLQMLASERFSPQNNAAYCLNVEYISRPEMKTRGLVYLLSDNTINVMAFPDLRITYSAKCFEDNFPIINFKISNHGSGYYLSSPTSLGWFTLFRNDRFGCGPSANGKPWNNHLMRSK